MQDYEVPFDENGVQELEERYSHKLFKKYLQNDVVDRALGCLFGSFIGDALGAYLQFAKQNQFEHMMHNVMDMPGGGVFKLKPGQVTDDSEMAFHLLHALNRFGPKSKLRDHSNQLLLDIACEYLKWGQSKPFDIGITCRKGIDVIKSVLKDKKTSQCFNMTNIQIGMAKQLIEKVQQKVYETNKDSQSNGSLMRITPLPFYFGILSKAKQPQQQLKEMKQFIKGEAGLLHPNLASIEVSYRWSNFLNTLIKRKTDFDFQDMYKSYKYAFESSNKIGWGEFIGKPIDARVNIGWSKIAISLGFESFQRIIDTKPALNEDLYQNQMRKILSRGGDTDTNAAIVGGMLGALIGFKRLPSKYITKLMNLRHPQKATTRQNRPKFYEPRSAFVNAYLIINRQLEK